MYLPKSKEPFKISMCASIYTKDFLRRKHVFVVNRIPRLNSRMKMKFYTVLFLRFKWVGWHNFSSSKIPNDLIPKSFQKKHDTIIFNQRYYFMLSKPLSQGMFLSLHFQSITVSVSHKDYCKVNSLSCFVSLVLCKQIYKQHQQHSTPKNYPLVS